MISPRQVSHTMHPLNPLVMAAVSLRDLNLVQEYIRLNVDFNMIKVNGYGVFDALIWSQHLYNNQENLQMFKLLTMSGTIINMHIETLKYASANAHRNLRQYL